MQKMWKLKTVLPHKQVEQQKEIEFQGKIEKDVTVIAENFHVYYVDSIAKIVMDYEHTNCGQRHFINGMIKNLKLQICQNLEART